MWDFNRLDPYQVQLTGRKMHFYDDKKKKGRRKRRGGHRSSGKCLLPVGILVTGVGGEF